MAIIDRRWIVTGQPQSGFNEARVLLLLSASILMLKSAEDTRLELVGGVIQPS